MLAVKDLYWVAGLIEGEGHFGLRRGVDLVVELSSTDKDVIDRLEAVLGFGRRRERLLPSGKTNFQWAVGNQSQAAGLMMTLLPLMCGRRAARIRFCLEAWKSKRLAVKLWTHCKNGHELAGDNLRVTHEGRYEKRRCIECGMLRQRKYRERLAA